MTTISAIEHDLLIRIPQLISLWRGNKKGGSLTSKELKTAGDALFSLQRGLTGNRQLAGDGYMNDSALLGAYLLYYWPVSYMQTALAASCSSKFFTVPEHRPLRILDLGSGPGPASCALADHLWHSSPGIQKMEFMLADSSGKALELAAELLQRRTTAYGTVQVSTRIVNLEQNINTCLDSDSYDIIIMSHVLNELWNGSVDRISRRGALLEEAAGHLSPKGILFLSEPALLETSRSLLAVRDMLVSKGFTILFPCSDSAPCPALTAGPNHTCHAEIAWQPVEPVASLAKTAGLDRESVKMSFIIAVKKSPGVEIPADTTKKNDKKIITARVVSDGMLNKSGRIRFLLCDGHTRFAFSAKNGDADAKAAGFFTLQRYDLIEVTSPELRGDKEAAAYGFVKETKLRIISRIGS